MKIIGIILALFAINITQAHADVICDCTKHWTGGPAYKFVGSPVYAGQVSGSDRSDALDWCGITRPVAFYRPQITNCIED